MKKVICTTCVSVFMGYEAEGMRNAKSECCIPSMWRTLLTIQLACQEPKHLLTKNHSKKHATPGKLSLGYWLTAPKNRSSIGLGLARWALLGARLSRDDIAALDDRVLAIYKKIQLRHWASHLRTSPPIIANRISLMALIRCLSTHNCTGTIDTGDDRAHSEPIFPVEGVLRAGPRPTKPTDIPHAFRRTFFSLPHSKPISLPLWFVPHASHRAQRYSIKRCRPPDPEKGATRSVLQPDTPHCKPRRRHVVQPYHNATYNENSAASSPHRHNYRAYRCCRWSDRATA